MLQLQLAVNFKIATCITGMHDAKLHDAVCISGLICIR
eukprot:SAG22_NODE_11215_length_495_cov_0.848485_1_plen_37_part_10